MSRTIREWQAAHPEEALAQRRAAFEKARTPEHQSKAGKLGGKATKESGTGIFGIPHEEMQEYRMRGIETQRELGIGFFRERTEEENRENAERLKKVWAENPELRDATGKRTKKWHEENSEEFRKIMKVASQKGADTRRARGDFESEAHKAKWQMAIASAQETVACPSCGKTGNKVNMKRWHFDNCKLKAPFELMPDDKHLTKKELLDLFNDNGLNMDIKAVSRFIAKHPLVSIVGKPKSGANGKNAPKYKKSC